MLRKKTWGLVRILRPELPFAAGVSVLMGEIIALGKLPPAREALLGFSCGFFLSSFALITNDIFDLEVDRINAPWRPLPSGAVTIGEAVGLSILVTLGGLATALAIHPSALAFGIFVWIIGIAYNWKFKKTGLPGNLMVSTLVAATFVLGGMAVGRTWSNLVWFFALGAFLLDLAEEIAGDAMDMNGDRLRGSRSLAILYGRAIALHISAGIFALVFLLTAVPLLLGWLGIRYLLAIIVVDLGLIYFTAKLLRSENQKEGMAAMRGIYLGFLAGMLVYILGQFFI